MSRLIAWTAFLLGIAASTAANVAHARDGLGPRLAAAVAPVALILAVELAVRLRWKAGVRWWLARWLGTGLVGLVTAVVSYRHQSALLGTYGEDHLNAAILPLSIDGLMLVAAAALLSLGPATRVAHVASLSQATSDMSPPVAHRVALSPEVVAGAVALSHPDVAPVACVSPDVSPLVAATATWERHTEMVQGVEVTRMSPVASDNEATSDISDIVSPDDSLSQRRVARAAARRRQREAARARAAQDDEKTGD